MLEGGPRRVETTLPYGWYTDPEILRGEQERIFGSTWQYVGHTGQLAQPGFFAAEAGRTPIVVTRDREGVLRGLDNVAGTAAASSPRAKAPRALQCPYHAWTYGLDGRLRAAPRSEEEPDFPQDELCLLPVAVDTWGPFVFANATPTRSPRGCARLAAGAGRRARARRRLPRPLLALGGRDRGELEDRLRELPRVLPRQVAHPGFSELIDVSPEAYLLSNEGRLSTQHGPLRT